MEARLKEQLKQERLITLRQIESFLNLPITVLAFVWLFLTILDFVQGLSPFLNQVQNGIWIVFWINFLIEFTIAPLKKKYLSENWVTLIALIIPGIRILRAFRFLRYMRLLRGTRLIRILTSLSRGMGALARSLGRRGYPYVIALTLMVIALGAAGIMEFEQEESDYFTSYASALWWTSMMITTMGSDYFPLTSEGRFLALVLAIYGFAVFGYVTATVASFFIDRDAASAETDLPNAQELRELRQEVQELKKLLVASHQKEGDH